MSNTPPPFANSANRLRRTYDETFANMMSSEKAIVRLLAPRRVGKTDLVSYHARTTRTPLLNIAFMPLAADIAAPAQIVTALLTTEIEKLAHTAPKLHSTYSAMLSAESPPTTRRSLAGEIGAQFPLPVKLTASAERASSPRQAAQNPAEIEVGSILRRLELAASKLGVRPIVFFDEVQELIASQSTHAMPTVWAIRNEIQHHTACRYVFAGSNQRLFAELQSGRQAPLLNLGSALEMEPLTTAELDAWAVPLFRNGGRHVRSLGAATELLCGKIGEAVEVFNALWASTRPGDVLDDKLQREAVATAASSSAALDLLARKLSPAQSAALRWIVHHPGESPYSTAALAATGLNPGTVSTSLRALVEAGIVEHFGKNIYSPSTPLRILHSLSPGPLLASELNVAPLPEPRAPGHQQKRTR